MSRQVGEGQGELFDGEDVGDEVSEWWQGVLAHREVHKCENCNHSISAREARASGLGEKCAAQLGREVYRSSRKRE